jgi:ADP-ribose pyrophosphatase YjhB (NUDIX family)
VEDTWLTWAKRLQSIAATGLHFSRDRYDRERYHDITCIANEMLASIGSVPIAKIEALVSDFAKGYATPRVDVRGAVFSGDKILLVREATDGLWTLPGGFADVGISPGENIVKEIWEEACIRVTAKSLYAVRHKAKHAYDADVRDFYKLFFLCDPIEEVHARPGPETTEVGFFDLGNIPPLSTGRVIAEDITAAYAWRTGARSSASFD